MISWSDSTGLTDAQRFVPLRDGLKVRRHQTLNVVLSVGGQLLGARDNEPGPAVERAPDPVRRREPVAALDAAISRTQQAQCRPIPARQHEVAGQWGAVPREQVYGFGLPHPEFEPEEQVAHAARGVAGRRLERGELFDLVDHPQPIRGTGEQYLRRSPPHRRNRPPDASRR